MMKRLAALVALALLLVPGAAFADGGPSYDDPAVHFAPPDGWTRLDLPPGDDAPVAAFRKEIDRNDTRVISIKITKDDSSLDTLAHSHESELRSQQSDVFIDKKERFTMANGMPAWRMRFSIGGVTNSTARILEYVVSDGKRSIIASYSGRASSFDDKAAEDALSGLTVVLYPQGR